ncbi:1,2-diacylglycerol 3-beta-galactosyltransferase [Burkholderiales bacterium 8X]|nr:1,2-diacylglycerol 3-beta-galactosyltransferase [Burkholderiales bacterium 8X]
MSLRHPAPPAPATGPHSPRRKVTLVYIDAGGGHRASSAALQAAIHRHGLPWDVRPVHLRDMIDPRGTFFGRLGVDPEVLYNQRLARGWTFGLAKELKLLQALIRWAHAPMSRQLQAHWLAEEPDMVVSLIPNFNRVLRESLAASLPGVPYVTLLTDLADLPPHFWIEPGGRQHVICGTPRAVLQARAAGHPAHRIHATSGMMIRPEFYDRPAIDRAAQRKALGLDPDLPTGIVLFGGHGSRAMIDIARRLQDRQLILACGHNQKLARELASMPSAKPHHVLGFSTRMAHYMQLADYMIGKPGPGALSEAVQMSLPSVVVRNRSTLPQERYNTDWLREHDLGLVCSSFRHVEPAVRHLLADLERFQSATRRVRNRSVFEVPGILERIMVSAFAVDGAAWQPSRIREPGDGLVTKPS